MRSYVEDVIRHVESGKMDGLSEEQTQVVYLVIVEQKPWREIAMYMDTPPIRVKRLYIASMRKLRRMAKLGAA